MYGEILLHFVCVCGVASHIPGSALTSQHVPWLVVVFILESSLGRGSATVSIKDLVSVAQKKKWQKYRAENNKIQVN